MKKTDRHERATRAIREADGTAAGWLRVWSDVARAASRGRGLRRARMYGTQVAGRWGDGWGQQLHDVFEVAGAMLAGGYGPSDWLADAVSLTINAATLLVGLPPHLTSGLHFVLDGVAEMAGPRSVALSAPPSSPPVASDLKPVNATAGLSIPREHVVVRIEGSVLTVTLVDLRALRRSLVLGKYAGVIDAGSEGAVSIAVEFVA